jgi:hypothetical protein
MIDHISLGLCVSALAGPVHLQHRCPCVVPQGVDWRSAEAMVPAARQDARAIFLGVVVAVDTIALDTLQLANDTASWHRPTIRPKTVRYRFRVERSWKGARSGELTVTVYWADTDCGRDFVLGTSYLVYAGRDTEGRHGQGLSTYACSRVLPEGEAEPDLKILGSGRKPRPGG